MSKYGNRETLLAEADLKADLLDEHLGVAFIEGEDDRRCLAGRFIPHEQLVVTDGKRMLLEAYRAYERTQGVRYVFITDCDYDVPAGELRPQSALIVTRNPSLETDLVDIGLLAQIVEEFIPRGKWRGGSAVATLQYVTQESVALAEGLGRLRCVAREERLRLRFSPLRERLRKYRRDGRADIDKMVEVLGQQAARVGGRLADQGRRRAARRRVGSVRRPRSPRGSGCHPA